MGNACCCYIVNEGYLFPTLLSALQARRNISLHGVDVTIFCIGEATPATALFARLCAEHQIVFRLVPARDIDHMPIMFARFFLHRLLDDHYRRVVYIDGDTQVSASLDPLIAIDLKSGKFLAARDPMSIMIDKTDATWSARRGYFSSIGLQPDLLPHYCNSGVLRFDLADWGAVSRESLRISQAHAHGLRFPDQDALNLAFGGDYLTMSFKWNFPIFFLNCGFETFIKPRIHHFMSNPRPWEGPFAPWGRSWHDSYRQITTRHPELKPFMRPLRRLKFLKYVAQQHYKALIETRPWRMPDIRLRVERIEAEAYV